MSHAEPMNHADLYLENNLDDFIPHPTLQFFNDSQVGPDICQRSNKLYLVPTTHGESYDPDFAPNPSSLAELPNLERWTLTYVVSAIEIMAGRRPVQQLARSTHRFTYNSLLRNIGSVSDLPKIKRIHRNQPIEGVVELTAILSFKDRVRALIARFEGVDKKWLCTELELL